MSSGNPSVQALAAGALGRLEYRPALPQLRTLLQSEQPAVRMYAAIAVKRLGDPSGDAGVAAMLQSPIPQLRLMAAEAYQTSATTQWVAPVRELLSDQSETTRLRAAEMLACCDKVTARAALVTMLDSAIVRLEAARILEDKALADPPLIRRLLGDADPWVRMYGAGAALDAASVASAAPKRTPPAFLK